VDGRGRRAPVRLGRRVDTLLKAGQVWVGATHQRWPDEWFARSGLLSLKAEHEWTLTIVALQTR
jgi:hypothetical protein